MAAVAVPMVDDVHVAVIVHPEFADDNIVHSGRHLAPGIMVARLGEH